MKFKAPIEIQAGISDGDPTNPLGISGYLLSSDGSNVNWVSPGELSAETAEAVVQPIKANEALAKGDPVYIVGYQTGQDVNIVAKADSSDPTKMPVVGLADDDYANQAFGTMTAFGSFNGDFDTTGPGTENWVIGDIIFVKPGGGLTNIKPVGTDLIQNVAIVSRVNSQTGELEVIALGRTNDVPNLPEGRLFVGTAANTSLASDVVYVDDTNDRVGIRTTGTPSTNLEVSSSSNLNGIDISVTTNPTQSGALFFTTNTLSEGFMFRNANGTFQINSGGIPNSASGTNRISIIGSSGNVGIGTTSPITKLDVYGGLRLGTTGDFYITQSPFATTQFFVTGGGNGGTIIFGAPLSNTQNVSVQGDLYSYQGSIGTQQFGSFNNKISYNGDNYLNSGNLGIGTTNPYAKLHVASTSSNNVPTAGTATGGLWVSTSSQTFGINMGVSSSGWGFIQSQRADTNTTLYNLNLQPLGGNVGIGTTSPTEKLEVEDSGTLGVNKDVLSITNRVPSSASVDTTVGMNFNLQQGSNSAITYGAIQVGEHSGTGAIKGSMRFMVQEYDGGFNLDEKMRIESNGNVGIGTTNPTRKLHVLGPGNSTPSDAGGIFLQTSGGGGLDIYATSTATNPVFDFRTFAGEEISFSPNSTELMRLKGSNVGIGTTSPNEKLEVNGSVRVTGAGLDVGYGNNSNNFVQIGNGRTTNGFAFIDLVGDTTYSDYGLRLVRNNGGANTNSEIIHRGIGFLNLTATQAGGITLKTSNVERVRVNSSGSVGIGTTSPAEKLEVNGYVKASSGYKGYLPAFQHGGFYHSASSSSSTIYWIPTNYFSETTSSQYYNNWVAPYSGRVKKIVMRWASGTTPTATSVTFRKSINGGGDLNTYPATIANAASTNMTATKVFGSTDIAFNEGDRVRIGFTTDGGTRLLYGFAYTIVLEYNKD